jgi:hypothetical protein
MLKESFGVGASPSQRKFHIAYCTFKCALTAVFRGVPPYPEVNLA